MGAMTGRIAVVTGGNSGIGKETVVELARLGAHVVLAARNRAKADDALAEARTRSGSDAIEVLDIDLASFESIRSFVAEFRSRHDRLHALVNNAGLIQRQRHTTENDLEMTFGVNHVGHFLLTKLLTDTLIASAPARVVVVSSEAHRTAGGLDWKDLQAENRYRPFKAYSRSKLANILFARELARRLSGTGVTANSLHPGFVGSNFGREGDTGLLGSVLMVLGRPLAISNARGARTSVHLASSPEVARISGEYFVRCKVATPSAHALDDDAAAQLWEVSEALVGKRSP